MPTPVSASLPRRVRASPARAVIAGASDMDLMVEDQTVASGATPSAGSTTTNGTIWLMSTVVFKTSAPASPTVPGAPNGVTATAGNAQATVTWTAPANGGSPISSYTVTPFIGSTAQSPTAVTGNPPATTATVTGLTNGTAYTFTVTATNAVGTSAASAASNTVTPAAQPQGQWAALQSWPLVAIHDIQLNNGKYLLFDGWTSPTPTQVWDPVSNTFTTVNAPGQHLLLRHRAPAGWPLSSSAGGFRLATGHQDDEHLRPGRLDVDEGP